MIYCILRTIKTCMEEIYDTNDAFDFAKLSLSTPVAVGSGTFFIRYLMNNTHLYIQPPKCFTKQGILKSGKKLYTDLIFTNENENFIRWMENLESYTQKYIYTNREQWFEGDMEMHDIENYFTSPIKVYKSGKYYNVRTNIQTVLGKPILKIYDENENDVALEDINDKTSVMTILEISGIKCSSRSFQIEIELKQMLTLKPSKLFEKLLLKPTSGNGNDTTTENIDQTQNAMSQNILLKSPQDIEKIHDNTSTTIAEPTQNITVEIEENQHIENISTEKPSNNNLDKKGFHDIDEIEEIDFPLEELKDADIVHIKQRNDIYYSMYKEARKKAKFARDFAVSSYLEAKNIKNKYMLDDVDESDESDVAEDLDFDKNDVSV